MIRLLIRLQVWELGVGYRDTALAWLDKRSGWEPASIAGAFGKQHVVTVLAGKGHGARIAPHQAGRDEEWGRRRRLNHTDDPCQPRLSPGSRGQRSPTAIIRAGS